MTKFASPSFSVGVGGSKEYDEAYKRIFGQRPNPRACSVCGGEGRTPDGLCLACEGTGLRSYQRPETPEG
jgi:DnaJ-class molecular chaperone